MRPTPSHPVRGAVVLDRRRATALAGAAVLGAHLAWPLPWPVGAGGVLLTWRRRPVLALVAVTWCVSGLSAAAFAGLDRPTGPLETPVTVVRDPVMRAGILTVEGRTPVGHLDLTGGARVTDRLRKTQVGERLVVVGTVRALPSDRGSARWRHVGGRMDVTGIRTAGRPAWYWRAAETVRSTVRHLGAPLDPGQRALFEGFVLGDASGQTELAKSDFQGSGLTHLLVASGANVAFLVVLAGPLLRRCGLTARWAVTMGLLAGFVLVTRAEPSVLRAAVMAAITTSGAALGRPTASARNLALAVAILVTLDPFLVHSVGFTLSVGASLGVLVLSGPLTTVFRRGGWARTALTVTVAAQIGVAPILLGTFGTLPVAALPANVLAAPAAGVVMTVGLPTLVVAALPVPGAALCAVIPRVLLSWIALVARVGAAAPFGSFSPITVAVATACLGGAYLARRADRDRSTRLLLCGAVVCCVAPGVALAVRPPPRDPGAGVHLETTPRATVIVLTHTVSPGDVLAALARTPVRRVDALVVANGDRGDLLALEAIRHRYPVTRVLVPPSVRTSDDPDTDAHAWATRGGVVAHRGDRYAVGDLHVEVVLVRPLLAVEVREETVP